jgi:predicted small integral membrane protein
VPITLLLYETSAMYRSIALLAASVTAGAGFVVLLAPRGDRLWLMMLVAAFAMLPYLRRRTRPTVLTMAVAVGLVFLIGITFLRSYRTSETRSGTATQALQSTITHPGQALKEFILGADTEMFPVLSLLVQTVPEHQGYQPGVTVRSLLTQPIPSSLYPDKPQSADSLINDELVPARAQYTRFGIAPSMFGGFYFDSGILGVLVGSFVVGVCARALFEYLRRNPTNAGVRLLFASSFPMVLVIVRGNPSDTLARATYTVFPLAVFFWVTGRMDTKRAHHAPPGPLQLGGAGEIHGDRESN